MLLSKPISLLLLGAAWAQQSPSIEDMLADNTNTIHAPNAVAAGSIPASYPASAAASAPYSAPASAAPASQLPSDVPASAAATGPTFADASAPKQDNSQSLAQQGPQFPPVPSASASPANSVGNAFSGQSGGPSLSNVFGKDAGTSGASPGAGGMGGMGAMLGAMQGSMGSDKPAKKDMFGRKPSGPAGGLGALFGGLGGGGGASKAPAKPNPIMDSLLKSVEARMPMNQKIAEKNGISKPISQESRQIVSGLVEAFMHKVQLNPGEKSCLENNLATLTADIVGTVEDLVKGIKAILAGKAKQNVSHAVRAKSQGTLVSAGLDGSMKLTSLITLSTTLMKNCVQGDALEMLNATGRHLINAQYLGHRLLVSGVDIAHRISDSIIAFEGQNFHRFGQDIGIALRKILLSNSTRGARLPEGVPEQVIIQETTEGLFGGFFARGSGVEITDAAAPEVDIQLDLHRCIAGNHEFFKEVWLAMWNLIAELSVNAGQHDFQNPFTEHHKDGSQPKWMGEIMVAMMQIPSALARCNIDQEMQRMLMEAIRSIKYLKVHFLFPKDTITADSATQGLAKAVEAWTNWDFKGFGEEIGRLLREFVMLMYPQQYSVDAHGRLRRQLISESSKVKDVKVAGLSFRPTFGAVVVGGVSMSMLVALVAVRTIRSTSHHSYKDQTLTDAAGDNFLDVDLEVE